MLTTYTLWDDKNNRLETFAGPCRLAKWASLPEGWTIEEFLGDTSRGSVSLEYVKRHAAEVIAGNAE